MQCTVKYITSSAILVLPLLLLFLPTLISSLSRRDCLPTLTGTFDNHIIGMCLLCLYEVSIYEIFLRGRARTLYTYLFKGWFCLEGCSSSSSPSQFWNSLAVLPIWEWIVVGIFHFTIFFGNGCDFFIAKLMFSGKKDR